MRERESEYTMKVIQRTADKIDVGIQFDKELLELFLTPKLMTMLQQDGVLFIGGLHAFYVPSFI